MKTIMILLLVVGIIGLIKLELRLAGKNRFTPAGQPEKGPDQEIKQSASPGRQQKLVGNPLELIVEEREVQKLTAAYYGKTYSSSPENPVALPIVAEQIIH